MKNRKFVLLVLVPTFLHLTLFMVVPIVGSFIISFLDYNPLRMENAFIWIDNYKKMFQDPLFWKALKNTLVFVLVTVPCNIVLSLLFAQFISIFNSNKVRSFFRMVFFLPCIAPLVASSVVWGRSIFSTKTGLLNILLTRIGLNGVNWLGDANILMISVIIFTLWADVGYNTILFNAGLDGIPMEFYEASQLDGAGPVQRFFNITLPLLGRTTAFIITMTLISHFQMFAQFSVMLGKSTPQNSGLVLTSYIYKNAFEYKDMGYASAVSIGLFLIIMVITLIQQRMNKMDWEY